MAGGCSFNSDEDEVLFDLGTSCLPRLCLLVMRTRLFSFLIVTVLVE